MDRWRKTLGSLQITAELCWRGADNSAKDLPVCAQAGVGDFERDFDQAALGWKARPRLRLRYGRARSFA